MQHSNSLAVEFYLVRFLNNQCQNMKYSRYASSVTIVSQVTGYVY